MIEEPHITLGPLNVWVRDRPYANSGYDWDANWLEIHAEVRVPGAVVSCEGPCLRTVELEDFLNQLDTAHRALSGTAILETLEPYLKIEVIFRALGHVELKIDITPDHLSQNHRFWDRTDQTYIQEAIRQIRAVLSEYPVVGNPPGKTGKPSASKLARIGSALADAVFGKKVDQT